MKNTSISNHYDNAPRDNDNQKTMQGFDKEFSSLTDYILRITYRIWEGKQIGLCYDYYSDDCPVYTLAGLSCGAEDVVQGTLDTLAAFPDRTLHAEDIIYSGNAQDGYHSSHRIRTHMTNTGNSGLGKATNKHAVINVIAHCIVKDNKIIKEWLVRDNYLLTQQLGFEPHTIAKKNAENMDKKLLDWQKQQIERLSQVDCTKKTPETPIKDNAKFIENLLHNLWNAKMLGDIQLGYAENARFYGPSGRELNGIDEITNFYLQILGTLSNLKFSVDHICTESELSKDSIAVRWSITGVHTGRILYGKPTNQPIYILGESHYKIVNGKIYQEWCVFDELAVLTQVYYARINK